MRMRLAKKIKDLKHQCNLFSSLCKVNSGFMLGLLIAYGMITNYPGVLPSTEEGLLWLVLLSLVFEGIFYAIYYAQRTKLEDLIR